MKFFRNERGLTLIELLVSLSISAVIIGALGTAIYTIMNITGQGNNEILALHDVQNAGYWIRKDSRVADSISIAEGEVSANLTIWDESHVTSFYREGQELIRDRDGEILKIAWNISDVSFEVDNMSILTYVLVSSPEGKWDIHQELTGKVYLEELP